MKRILSPLLPLFLITVFLNSCKINPGSSPPIDEGVKFTCTKDDNWTTYANTYRGKVSFIVWKSLDFLASGYSPRDRCQLVSIRLQNFYDNGTLDYFVSGNINKHPVICVAESKDEECVDEDKIVLTLQPDKTNEEVKEAISTLIGVRDSASNPLYNSQGNQYLIEKDGIIVVDIWNYLQTADVERDPS